MKPATACCTPQPTVIASKDEIVAVAAPAPGKTDATSAKRPEPLSINEMDAKLDANLADWEKASSRIHRVECGFQKFMYDPIFAVEKRGEGTIAVECSGPARYCVVPAAIMPGAVPNNIRRDGAPFRLEACPAETWHWTGSDLFKFDEQERTYERFDVEPSHESNKLGFFRITFTNERLDVLFLKPFTLGMPADQLKKRFKIRQLKETGDELWLELIPRGAEDFGDIEKIIVILDRRTWQTRALKLYDPTGCQNVYILHVVKVNSEVADDLAKPNLEGYREVRSNETTRTESSK
jgi:hypothetical protein